MDNDCDLRSAAAVACCYKTDQKWVSSALLIVLAMIACIYIGELFAAGEVAFIMALGALLEDYAVARAKRGVNKLLSLAPDEARRLTAKRHAW